MFCGKFETRQIKEYFDVETAREKIATLGRHLRFKAVEYTNVDWCDAKKMQVDTPIFSHFVQQLSAFPQVSLGRQDRASREQRQGRALLAAALALCAGTCGPI